MTIYKYLNYANHASLGTNPLKHCVDVKTSQYFYKVSKK